MQENEPMVILIVDDDAFARARIKQCLRESMPHQYMVYHEADWGREAASLLEHRPYDCVFMNCALKDMGAIGILRQIYDSEIGICTSPIVLMAAEENEHEMMEAFRLGAEDYLLKGNMTAVSVHIALSKARDMHALRKDRHRTERELAHIRKMEAIGQLTSGVAHDFNNLLNVVMGNVTQLRRKMDNAPLTKSEIADRISAIESASQRGADLIQRLMQFSRRAPLAPQATDPNACILETAALLRNALGSNIVIETALGTDLWAVVVDRAEFQNALINFAVNARDAMPGGGVLRITTQNMPVDVSYAAQHRGMRPGSYVVLTIHDNGTGMDEQTKARVFEPFFTTKQPGAGSGLGMSMAYGFIKDSGGYVSVDSRPGQGTTFRLYLPKAADNDTAQPLEPHEQARA